MRAFTRLTSVAAPLALANVDTDMIIPAQHMKSLIKFGLGKYLFQAIRFHPDGTERTDFILNHPSFRAAEILIADRNFGCGSSREHAVWALIDFGIRCVIAPSFGDIFASNARKNGLLLIPLSDQLCETMKDDALRSPFAPYTIDLEELFIQTASGERIFFNIDPDDRRVLMEGLDDIDRTLRHSHAISQFEARN